MLRNGSGADRNRVVIIGGGFGGMQAAQHLKRANVDVTVVDRHNHLLFQPLIYQVAAGALSAGDVAAPQRHMLKRQPNASVVMGTVTDVDVEKREVVLDRGDRLGYDSLIVACGGETSYFGNDAWREVTCPMKTLADALDLRDHIFGAFEEAERSTDPTVREEWLTFVVVGGGPTGVEISGQLAILSRHTMKRDFRRIDPRAARVILLDAGDRIVAAFKEPTSAKAAQELGQLGVTVREHAMVTDIDSRNVTIKVGDKSERIATRTVVWAAGVCTAPIAEVVARAAGASTDRAGHVEVNPDLTLAGHPEISVIGDAAKLAGPDGRPFPGLATVAIQQARHVAQAISHGEPGASKPFRYFDKGALAVVGRGKAVCEIRGHRLSGLIAFLIYISVHLAYLGGVGGRRITVGITAIGTLFGSRENRVMRSELPSAAVPGPPEAATPRRGPPDPGSGRWAGLRRGGRRLMANDLARWQFATTSVYHFIFVPVTIGLAFLVAMLQTAWYRTDNPDYKRMTRFFGTLLLINVAIGVVTGLVQEFEFGMNWSTYSRFVGGVFGAPLAMEGLAAFFLESTFLGLWLFGWDRLPRRIHLATIWAVSLGTMLSAMFILMANSWMQHPVGYKMSHGQAVLTNIWALFVNPTFLWGYAHVILASLVTGALVMLAVSAWYLRKQRHVESFHRTAKVALIVLIPAIVIQLSVGNKLGQIEAEYQPMKIAAAEALWNSCKPCSFSIAQTGGWSHQHQQTNKIIEVPHLLSVLGTGTWNGAVTGLNQLQAQDQKKYGPGNYIPNVPIQYWSMRTMAYLGTLVLLLALWGGWLLLRGTLRSSRVFLLLGVWAVVTPFLMNTAGWLLTESGRQPWIVQGLQKTVNANSPSVSATDIWISLSALVLIYIVLGAADVVLMLRYSRSGLPAEGEAEEPTAATGAVPALTY